jgi:membrane protein required for colicin V production
MLGNSMHWFDVVVGIALFTGGIWSFFRGLTREVLSILGIIAAIMLSFRGYPYVATHLSTIIVHPWLRQVVGFMLIFLSTAIFYVLIATLLHRLVKAAGLSLPDRFLGGLFGIIKVWVMVAALCLVTAQFFPLLATKLTIESLLAPVLFRTAALLSTLLPDSASQDFQTIYRDLYRQLPIWVPSAPSAPQPQPPNTPTAKPVSPPTAAPEGISEQDARGLETILKKHLDTQ